MNKTGFLYDIRYLLHDTGPYHPEVPDRLQAIHRGISESGLLEHLTLIQAMLPDIKWIETVHDPDYIHRFQEVCLSGNKTFDYPDNQMCDQTFETAMLAVGGILETVDRVMKGALHNAFCAVRPPGHHAETDRALGFCYFNNVAIGARYLQQKWALKRIGIIDIDVHHGNGTQHIFEKDPTVFYYSIHEHPSFAYPGTGREFEMGTGQGHGFTKNSPTLPGQGDEDYKRLMERDLFPAFERFEPEFILVSAGFDAHVEDHLADMSLTTQGYSWIMERVMEMADIYADGKVISVLEGGYNLERLPELAKNHVEILLQA